MNTLKRSSILIPLVLMLSTLAAQVPGQTAIPPRECDCPLLRLTDAWCNADAVFLGTVTAADTVYARSEIGKWDRNSIDHISVGFIVDHVFKGEESAMKNVITADDRKHCGFTFRKDGTFLVFAKNEDGQLTTDRCDRTRDAKTLGRQFSDSLDYLMKGGTYEIAGVDEPQCD